MEKEAINSMELVPFQPSSPAEPAEADEDNDSSGNMPDDELVSVVYVTSMATRPVMDGSCNSLASIQGDVCRICHCEAEPGMAPLISPCACAGTLRYVHQSCLQQWIKSANTKSCELCKLDFQMTTTVKPFRKWQKLEMTKLERRKVFCSVTFHIIAITCVVWSLYVLIDRTTEEIRAGVLEWPFWTKLIVVAIGFTGGLVFMYVQCKMYIQLCRRWRAYNRVIYVQDCPTRRPPAGGGPQKMAPPVDGTRIDIASKSDRSCPMTVTTFEPHELHSL